MCDPILSFTLQICELIGCTKPKLSTMSNNRISAANLSVNLQTAIDWVRNWRNKYFISKENEAMPLELKAFTVSKADFITMMDNEDAQYIRFYLAAGPENGTAGSSEVPKLIIVGTDINGSDIIGQNGTGLIYDRTAPCPRMCDLNSPLFTLVDPANS